MEKNNKNCTNWLIGILIIIILLIAFNVLHPTFNISQNQETLQVYGSSTILIQPDRANIYINVITLEQNAQQSTQENAKISQNVINSLNQIGIDNNNIQTQSFNLIKKEVYNSKTQMYEFIGYELTHTLKVSTNNINKTGEIIDTAINAGANTINNIIFDLSDTKKQEGKNLVLTNATMDAQNKAQLISDNLNIKLGKITQIQENSFIITPYYTSNIQILKEAETTILPKEVELSTSITINYEIK